MSDMNWVTERARERVEHMIEDLNRAKALFDAPNQFDTYRSRLKNVYMTVTQQLADDVYATRS